MSSSFTIPEGPASQRPRSAAATTDMDATPSPRSDTETVDEALVARVEDLGRYDTHGPDDETDRACTYPAWITSIILDNGASITIYRDADGPEHGFIETAVGAKRHLNLATLRAITAVLDRNHFPYYDN